MATSNTLANIGPLLKDTYPKDKPKKKARFSKIDNLLKKKKKQ
jgi:hypothetical protein